MSVAQTGPGVPEPLAVVGAGRMGSALSAALRAAGLSVSGPHGRGYQGTGAGAVLLCVPDDAIAEAAGLVEPGVLVGHCSGACGLGVLGERAGFSVHPLMTATRQGADFTGAWAAVDGTDDRALETARSLAELVGLRPVRVADADRAAYHASASIAANYLITVQAAAAELLATTGLEAQALVPIARAALDNWARMGAAALTGPVARGDRGTVAAHRRAVVERTPALVPLVDVLVEATERLAASGPAGPGQPPGSPTKDPS